MSAGKTFPQVYIIILSLPLHKSPPLAEKEDESVNPQILVEFYPPGLILHIGPF